VSYSEIEQGGGHYEMGLRNGSPPAGSRGSGPVGLWGEAPEAEFILNHMHVIQ